MRNRALVITSLLLWFAFPSLAGSAHSWVDRWIVEPEPDLDLLVPPIPARPLLAALDIGIAANVNVSGTVTNTDVSGPSIYANVIAYESSTKIIRGQISTTYPDGTYALSIPAGTYDFYVRETGPKPTVMTNVVISGTNQILNFSVGGYLNPPGYLSSLKGTPRVVFADGIDSSTVRLTSTNDLGPSIDVFNEYGTFTVNGAQLGVITLYDNGTNGDTAAGDRVYMRSGIAMAGQLGWDCGTIGGAPLLYSRIGGNIVRLPSFSLIAIEPTFRPAVTILQSGQAQSTSRAANIVADTSAFQWEIAATNQFYTYFDDGYDFLIFFPESFSGGQASLIRNSVTGIGQTTFNDTAAFGSSGQLQLLVRLGWSLSPPTIHETTHRWGNFLQPLFDPDTTFAYHWGYSGVNGVLGGFDPATMVNNGNGTYTVGFFGAFGKSQDDLMSPLERYLAGFSPLSDVPTITVFHNPQPQAFTFTPSQRTDVTPQMIVNQFGPRVPASTSAQRAFRAGFVGVTDALLSAAEMAYLDRMARKYSNELSGLVPGGCQVKSLAWASGGTASAQTVITTRSPSNLVATATSPTTVSLTWSAFSGAVSYDVYRTSTITTSFTKIDTTAATSYNDTSLQADKTYLYRVEARNAQGGLSLPSALDAATTVIFTDTITAGSTPIRVVHLSQLRTAVNAMRAAAAIPAASFTDPTLGSNVQVKATHLTELRGALNSARSGIGLAALSYTDTAITPGSTLVKRVHIQELRNGSS